jgi:hypothetical protein
MAFLAELSRRHAIMSFRRCNRSADFRCVESIDHAAGGINWPIPTGRVASSMHGCESSRSTPSAHICVHVMNPVPKHKLQSANAGLAGSSAGGREDVAEAAAGKGHNGLR